MKNIQDILEYKLIDLENFFITPYHIILVLAIIAFTKFALWAIKKVIHREELAKKVGTGRQHALYQIIKYVLIVIAIAIILESIGIKITFLLAGSAALLVGLGFGLQQTFSDFISGLILLFEGTIKVGEIIEVEGIIGRVQKIGLRTSEIETRDNIIMIMPNSKFTSEMVINWSHNMQPTRVSIPIGVAYGTNTNLVQKVLLGCAEGHNWVVKKPEPRVRFRNFGDSSLQFELLVYTYNMFQRGKLQSDIRFLIDEKFRDNGIHIPFPQRDLHIIGKGGEGKGAIEGEGGDEEK